MAMWGAIDVDSPDAAREVLEHSVVASVAHVSRLFLLARDRLGVAWCAATRPGSDGTDSDGAALLRWMAKVQDMLRGNGADPRWHGRATFVWTVDAPTLNAATDAVANLVPTDLAATLSLRWGVAHGAEADDPVDLLRLAAARSALGSTDARIATTSMRFPLSAGEQARLAVISANRNRQIEPLIREALDLLSARHELSTVVDGLAEHANPADEFGLGHHGEGQPEPLVMHPTVAEERVTGPALDTVLPGIRHDA